MTTDIDWKARAEAAEFAWKDPATMHLNLLRTGILTREQALHLAGATDYDALKARAKAAEARVKHLEDVLKARDLEEDDWSEEAEVQEARIAELEASEEALQQKLDTLLAGGETCGCSYDRPGDYCMHHSPALMQARARIADLEARLARVPDREAVARAIATVLVRPSTFMGDPPAQAMRVARDAADAAIAAMQETKP
jgi:septal ring factor EnvC (AmiA/AmiB activator)